MINDRLEEEKALKSKLKEISKQLGKVRDNEFWGYTREWEAGMLDGAKMLIDKVQKDLWSGD